MNIYELRDFPMNEAIAYILGLIFPFYKEINIYGNTFVAGAINHNPGKVTPIALKAHFDMVNMLFEKYLSTNAPELAYNKTNKHCISQKEGFSVLVNKSMASTEECKAIIEQRVQEIKNAENLNIKKEFAKGCFDGRSSWDTTSKYLALDVDRDYAKQQTIRTILSSLNVSVNINNRTFNHPKNDQIRIRKESLRTFMNNVGLYSICRKSTIECQMSILGI